MTRTPLGSLATIAPVRDLPDAARALYPLLDTQATAIEQAGTLTEPALWALKDAGIFDMLVLPELGGGGVDVLTALEVFEEITRANVAAGWAALVWPWK